MENSRLVTDLQDELSQVKQKKEELAKYIRELEQSNDDLERAKRYAALSLSAVLVTNP